VVVCSASAAPRRSASKKITDMITIGVCQ
jgi:hypothetical protein